MLKRLVLMCALVLAALPVAARAAEVKSSVTKSGKPHFEASQQVTGEATVLSINKSKRIVKILTAEGDTVAIECGAEVKNFAQIQVKDVVTATYTEKLTVEVEGPGDAQEAAEASVSAAKPGEKPKGAVNAKVTYKANITAIDKEKGTVTLKGTDGEEHTITPRNKANLDKVQVGELVVFTYSENLAVSVTKSGAKTATK